MARQAKNGKQNLNESCRLTRDLRESLKNTVFNELETLSQNLTKLTLKERLEYVSKLLPYVLPKVDSVKHTTNEPFNWDIG